MRASDEQGDAEPTADASDGRDISPSKLLSPESSARLGSPESSKRSVGKAKKGAGTGKRRIRKKTRSVVPRDMEATGTVLDSKGLRLFHLMRMFALNYTITGDMLLSLIQLLGRGGGFPSEEVRLMCHVGWTPRALLEIESTWTSQKALEKLPFEQFLELPSLIVHVFGCVHVLKFHV